MKKQLHDCPSTKQQGATLIVALVVLLALTLISTSAVQSNILQSRMVANQQNQEIAFQAAEMGLLDAEKVVKDKPVPDLVKNNDWGNTSPQKDTGFNARVFDSRPASGCDAISNTSGYLLQQLSTETVAGVSRWKGVAQTFSATSGAAESYASYELTCFESEGGIMVDQEYSSTPGIATFRITSLSQGRSGDSEMILQTKYKRQYR